jgi:hypothetical protein
LDVLGAVEECAAPIVKSEKNSGLFGYKSNIGSGAIFLPI